MNKFAASPLRRLAATAIDYLLVSLLLLVLVLVTGVMEDADAYVGAQPEIRLFLLLMLSYLLLQAHGLRRRGQTLGKRWLGLQLQSGAAVAGLGWWRLLVRGFGLLLLVLIAAAWMGAWVWLVLLLEPLLVFTRSGRTLRDYLAGTAVQPIQRSDQQNAALTGES